MIIITMKRMGLTVLFLLLPVFALIANAAPTLSAFEIAGDMPSWGLIKGVTPTGAVPESAMPDTLQDATPVTGSGNDSPQIPVKQRSAPISQLSSSVSADQTLSVIVKGLGVVHTNPTDIICRAACAQGFNLQAEVALTANPDPGYTFKGWSGACSGTEACLLVMDQHKIVGAVFSRIDQ